MKQTELIMGMPVTVEIRGKANSNSFKMAFDYFKQIDNRYSTYKHGSEISRINRGLAKKQWSSEMARVLRLCEQTKRQTNGYFDINHNGQLDPSGLVKGWAINNAAELLRHAGIEDFSIEAGGDIQVNVGPGNEPWLVGIRSPFNIEEIIKTLEIRSEGVATSGTYIRGQHIYNPLNTSDDIKEVRSLTVIGSDIYEADRFATAAFAMGRAGISFIESYPGLEGYMITEDEIATYTSGFERFVADV